MLKVSSCSRVLTAGRTINFSRHKLLMIKSNDIHCSLLINNQDRLALTPGCQGLLVVKSGSLKVLSGEIKCSSLNFSLLAKLLVFIDNAGSVSPGSGGDEWSYMPGLLKKRVTARNLEYWLIANCLQKTAGIDSFCNILRGSESYMLVNFLFNESVNNVDHQLQQLCQQYGLSSSHFRRLSRKALGKSTKTELRKWRLGRAMLELLNSDGSLTTIAMNNGYSSLSHFSNEMKDVMGLTPTKLKQQEWSE